MAFNQVQRRSRRRRPSHSKGNDKSAGETRPSTSRRNPQSARTAAAQPPPNQTRATRLLLSDIGTPAPAPFVPDSFQLEALAKIEHEDVLVTAPTGSGKTWIAREAIRRLLAAGKRAWYTSPLKALTNAKYHEFAQEFGGENVGILTGDRKEKPDAPLIVGTTEIYRNQLFDALRGGHDIEPDLVVLDEAHYLADEERGHVWEEAIILSPPRVRLLLLSATIGNAEELVKWISEVRGGRECSIVARPGARPVPLRAAFLYPTGALVPLLDEDGKFNYEIAQFIQSANASHHRPRYGGADAHRRPQQQRMNMPEMPPAILLNALGSYDLLPAIVFLPTRRRCDEAATEAALLRRHDDAGRRDARRHFLREYAAAHPEIRQHRHWDTVIRGGVGSHHAGHTPAWKLAIERLMSAGLLDAIFATATVAAGVDFPARTVVCTGVEVRTGNGWRQLSASEFQQMTGRAGRRSRDRVGFIVAAPGTHQNPQRIAHLLKAAPDPLESQFRATYSTLLNLLDAYGNFGQVREIVERSFAHRESSARMAELETDVNRLTANINRLLTENGAAHLDVNAARAFATLAGARTHLLEDAPRSQGEVLLRWLDSEVVPGRVVRIGRSGHRYVFVTERRGANVVGIREDGRRTIFALERVGRIYAQIHTPDEAEQGIAFQLARHGEAQALREPRLTSEREPTEAAVNLINSLMDAVAAKGVDDQDVAAQAASALWSVMKETEELRHAERQARALRAGIWQPFEQRARVLDHFNYLDMGAERVTERGRWLADLRTDRTLLVGEALERGLFAALDTTRMAGLMAALAADAERDYGELPLDDALVSALARFEAVAYDVASVEWANDLEPAPEINFSAAATAARWAAGTPWSDLVQETRAEEGDLIRMLSRTGEALLQIANLREAHPEAARAAAAAAANILREPVRMDELN